MALVGVRRLLLSLVMASTVVETIQRAGAGIDEYSRAGYHLGLCRVSERNLDHVDSKERRIRILIRLLPRAAGEFLWLAYKRSSRHIDIDIVFVVRVHHQRMRMRAAAGLHCPYLLRVPDIRDIEDPDTAKTL